ncbi:HlyD family secretion protein [Coraliomargarita akajimensis]|uniref:Secretion protein HlyD family protein n=1 Tax=Coraliomargarita akajimensis (strain DSM 45221 / IAM 15411 / JCM 23193 / KCTC 12865 / 04OKA010-24) TaxID=583355 RepID=D5EI86_CORAD|nr:HlyD family efflux transporter periplasmic adaptor subunit [Coraliomargarita akajimensis]ADE56126.1 secretion protein HlyD family protein [Coraliomargarita akajimensis DSM 45221]
MAEQERVVHLTKYRRSWWKNSGNWWPLLVFVAIAGMAYVLYHNGGKYRVMSGTAERIIEQIAPLESARVSKIHVAVGDRVRAGDLIVDLDTSLIDAEGAVLKEQIQQSLMEAKLEQLTLERQFASALQEAQQALREAELSYKVNRVEHSALLEELKRLEPLYQQQLIEAELIVAKKAREEVLREMLAIMPSHIEALEQDAQRAVEQQQSALARLQEMNEATSADHGYEEAVKLLEIRRNAFALRAQHDGVVAEIQRQPGETIEGGGSIVSLVVDGPTRIVGFLPESNVSSIAVGTPATIYPTVSLKDAGVVPAHVVQISPAVYSLPERASPIRGQVIRGRRVTFELDREVQLVPGETVSIEIQSGLFTAGLTEE